ncbi:MAG: hypothetical protein ABL906_11500, partial [Sideroxydans sp.]
GNGGGSFVPPLKNTSTLLTSTQNAIEMTAGSITFGNGVGAEAVSGGISLVATGAIELDNGDAGASYQALAGDIIIISQTGNIDALGGADLTAQNITLSAAGTLDIYGYTLGNIVATGVAMINTGAGLTNVGRGDFNTVTANSLVINAKGLVNLDTIASNLSILNSGNTTINNTGPLTSAVMTSSTGNIVLNNVGAATLVNLDAPQGSVTVATTGTQADITALSFINGTTGVTLLANGNLTLSGEASIIANNAPVILSAAGGGFKNMTFASVPIQTTGLIKIYSDSPSLNQLGSLLPDYQLFNCTYANGCAAGTLVPATQFGMYYASLDPTPTPVPVTPVPIPVIPVPVPAPPITEQPVSKTPMQTVLPEVMGTLTQVLADVGEDKKEEQQAKASGVLALNEELGAEVGVDIESLPICR